MLDLGKPDIAEIDRASAELFKKIDSDKSGMITKSEFQNYVKGNPEMRAILEQGKKLSSEAVEISVMPAEDDDYGFEEEEPALADEAGIPLG